MPDLGGQSAEDWLEAQQRQVESDWRAKLNRVEFDVPASGSTSLTRCAPRSRTS